MSSLVVDDLIQFVEGNDVEGVCGLAERSLLTKEVLEHRRGFHTSKVHVSSATPLWLACALGFEKIAATLIQYGADVNARNEFDESPLWIASKQGRKLVIQLLLGNPEVEVDQPNYSGQTPLIAAGGQLEVIRLLAEAGGCLTYGTPHTGTTVLHSCSRSSSPNATAALAYLLESAPTPAPVVGNAYGSLPVLSAAARRDEQVVVFWEERAASAKEREQVANAWELVAAQTCNWKRTALHVVTLCWLRAIKVRVASQGDSSLIDKKRERCAAVSALQTRGPLVGALELVEEQGAVHEPSSDCRISEAAVPLQDMLTRMSEASYPYDSLEPVFKQCCLCSERVLGLVQKGAIRSRLVYAIWLDLQNRRQDACELLLDFMTRQLEELAKAGCSHRFWHLCLIHVIQISMTDGSRYRDLVAAMRVEIVHLCTLALERCKIEGGTVAARHRLMACILHLLQLLFLSSPSVADLSGPALLEALGSTVVDAVARCVRADVRGLWDRSLLHLAMDSRTSQLHLSSTRIHQAAVFPHLVLTRLLLALEAPVNCTDSEGCLPMHLLLLNQVKDVPSQAHIPIITKSLLECRTHLDVQNVERKSCLDLARGHCLHESLATVLADAQPLQLLCLAAQAIRRFDIATDGIFPELLRSFVLLH